MENLFIHLLIAVTAGCLTGIVTGITPGIHINLVSVILVSISPLLLAYTNPVVLGTFIIAMSVVHTFLDTIPSIFLGAPDSGENALGVLPGHRYLLKGNGMMAVKLSVIGCFGAIIISIIIFPLLIPFVKIIYPYLAKAMFWLLLATVIFMTCRDRKRAWAVFIFVLSGSLGLIVLNIPNLNNGLFPMLSGLFGVSTLLLSLNDSNKIPEQKMSTEIKLKKSLTLKALLSGQFSGFITAVMPGLGAATAAVISLQITRKLGDHGFMILMGSIGTVNFVLSIAALQAIEKARNGSIIAVQQLLPMESISAGVIIIFLCATLIAGGISVFLTMWFGKIFSKMITKVNYKVLVILIISFIVILTIILTGAIGLLILFVSTAIGFVPALIKTTRTHSMGCLLLPVMMYFLPV